MCLCENKANLAGRAGSVSAGGIGRDAGRQAAGTGKSYRSRDSWKGWILMGPRPAIFIVF